LSAEELRTVVHETGNMIPRQHKKMLLGILDLDKVTVEDIMVQRNDIVGIDITLSLPEIREQLETMQHTRLPVYEETMDKVIGMIHIRHLLCLFLEDQLDIENLKQLAEPCYFVPEGTELHQQLLNFQQAKKRTALVVDEYGDIQGLVTLEDILEEIVGEFTTDVAAMVKEIYPQKDGSFFIDGVANLRDLNKTLSWTLPLVGPRTLSGLIIEHLGFIPPVQSCLKINDYAMEILLVKDNMVKMVRVLPPPPVIAKTA
jgi:Mg2+/Co2+ transporter CorB